MKNLFVLLRYEKNRTNISCVRVIKTYIRIFHSIYMMDLVINSQNSTDICTDARLKLFSVKLLIQEYLAVGNNNRSL